MSTPVHSSTAIQVPHLPQFMDMRPKATMRMVTKIEMENLIFSEVGWMVCVSDWSW